MAKGRSQFIGTAGQYYVSYGLAVRQIHASITIGNAPSVDILVSSIEGKKSLAIQVKTSRNAYRRKRYGREGSEWDVGAQVIGKHWESFWYALVDLRESSDGWTPVVYFVPSLWVGNFVKSNFSRKIYFLPSTANDITLERWDLVEGFLNGNEDVVKWANHWPEDKLVRWGTGS